MAYGLAISIDRGRLIKDLEQLSKVGRTAEGGVSRPAFSSSDRKAKAKVKNWMVKAGLEVREDPAGNIIGTRNGKEYGLPLVMTGSHLDTVPNGGRFDGALGVLGALEAIRALNRAGIETQRSIQMTIFNGEEPNPFGFSAFGSRAMTGSLPLSWLERSHRNTPFSKVLLRSGGDPYTLPSARILTSKISAFVELHIEQGPILDIQKIPIGIVSTLCGIQRLLITIKGRFDHAGTMPMNLRKDALAAGAEVILVIEDICKSRGEEIVGTVGKVNITPNQVNVVPGHTELEVDLRTNNPEIFKWIDGEIMKACKAVAEKRGLEISVSQLSSEPPIMLPEELSCIIAEVCQASRISYLNMPSWAGHDANHMAKITKTAVIFVPSRGGVGHCPEEWTDEEYLELGVKVLAETLIRLANRDE